MSDALAGLTPEARRRMLATLMHQKHRARFETLTRKAYLNFGAMGLVPGEVRRACAAYEDAFTAAGPFSIDHMAAQSEALGGMRADLAADLGITADRVALTGNTTTACNIALWGTDWQPGDRISVSDAEYPGVMASVHRLCARFQVGLDVWAVADDDATLLDRFAASLTPRTRLALCSHVLWDRPRVLPIGAMAAHARTTPTALLVDGAQALGVLPVDLGGLNPHYYAMTGHKWCCAPEGAGALAFGTEAMDRLTPVFAGPMGLHFDPESGFGGSAADARRFESGTPATAAYVGWRAVRALHRAYGDAASRARRIDQLTQSLKQRLTALAEEGLPVTSVAPHLASGGLVFFRVPHAARLVRTLEASGVLLRTIPETGCVRASLHYFSDEADCDRLIDGLRANLTEVSA